MAVESGYRLAYPLGRDNALYTRFFKERGSASEAFFRLFLDGFYHSSAFGDEIAETEKSNAVSQRENLSFTVEFKTERGDGFGYLFERVAQKILILVHEKKIVHIPRIDFNAEFLFDEPVDLIEVKHSENLTRLVAYGYASAALFGVGGEAVVTVFFKVVRARVKAVDYMG